GEALPTEVATLAAGFECVRVAALPNQAAKMVCLPDGRVLVTELLTGSIRVIDAAGNLLPVPFATVAVLGGGHLGLLGVAASPAFATDGYVFAYACTPGGAGKPDRGRVLRWRAVGDIGTDLTVLLDDLPLGAINNGGALCFDATGMLLVTVGDTEDPMLAQSDVSFAGKVLRLRPDDGGVPADNPDPASLVFAKGLRNTFAITLHPTVASLFLADNGPTNDDELDLLQAGRNYEWGGGGASFGAATGAVLRTWHDVVVPTGLAFQDPASGWPGEFAESLYLTFYDGQLVERFEMSGALRTDIDREAEFLRFATNGTANLPVDLQRGPGGSLWVLTFTGLFRVDAID
ncbi:MAG: PQQ-dependent sugar dehydrogenase, partial [Planctomycetes bacterium]|nr:PQQ-dependent sugar dehydrogenase [Planctomycetota bacterium]